MSSGSRLSTVLEHLPVAVLVCEEDGDVAYANPAARRIRGFERLEARNGSLLDYAGDLRLARLTGESVPPEEAPLARLLRDEEFSDLELRLHHLDTGERWAASVTGRVLRDDRRYFALMLRSIDDRIEAEDRFVTLFHKNPIPKLVVRLEGLEVREVNEAFLDAVGMEEDEVRGQSLHAVNHFVAPEQRQRLVQRLLADRPAPPEEFSFSSRSGQFAHLLLMHEPITLHGEPCWLLIFIDVTDRKRTEERLARAVEVVVSDAKGFSRSVMRAFRSLQEGGPAMRPEVELTEREAQVLGMAARGWRNDRIARETGLQRATIRNYLGRVYHKIGVNSKAEAVVWARERGMAASGEE